MQTLEPQNLTSPDKEFIREAFDSIAPKYDFLNTVLSFNLDESWRRRSREILMRSEHCSILDLGTGSGKFLQTFLSAKSWKKSGGMDFSPNMLAAARENLPKEVMLVQGDFHDLPFGQNEFDLIVSAFALRSVKDMPQFLGQVMRVLTPGGSAGFLCLTRPQSWWAKMLFYPYLKVYLPLVGWLVSGNLRAYRFLSDSVAGFQEPAETARAMTACGYQDIQIHVFTFGAATLITGKKPS